MITILPQYNCSDISGLYIKYRAAAEAELSVDALVAELKSSLEWSEGTIAAIRHIWKEEGPKLISMPKETLSIGKVSLKILLLGGLFHI